ncbi:hypothetical protein [Natranaerobius thermophilus]|uniref:hypothetical protein n=1 Tax=Natranaerobius thermophilus TaxID=375929 RepID=UPI0002D90B84|nr:hypothetical protein [Natranaerobius thermophilus]
MGKLTRRFFSSPKTKKAISWWIAYRGAKILTLYIVFREHPIIWIPTVITTTLLLYINMRTRNNNQKDNSFSP